MGSSSPAKVTRVLLVDDHEPYRGRLRVLLDQEPDMAVVGEAADGRTALRLIGELRPEAVVMDVGLPDLNGIEATRLVLASFPRVKVLALSMHNQPRFIEGMLAAGASCYLFKENADELPRALRAVVGGGAYPASELG